jgi:hypothetical protein
MIDETEYESLKSDFFKLLRWHLEKNCTSPERTKKRWGPKEFAWACFGRHDPNTVRRIENWLSDDPNRPREKYYPSIEKAFFGDPGTDDELYAMFRSDLWNAYRNAQKGRAQRPSVLPETGGAIGVTRHVDVASIQPLEKPRHVTAVEAEFTGPAHRIVYNGETFSELALLIEPFGAPWKPQEISWRALDRQYQPNEFWARVDAVSPVETPNPSDNISGKHIRLTAASQRRAMEDGYRLDFLWQPISWHDSCRTNQRVADGIQFEGAPLWAWFEAQDLLLPSADTYTPGKDNPLANRLAINLAIILRGKGEDWALFQERAHDVAASPRRIELGASESVHGFTGWPDQKEMDVRDGVPDILRTARRCLWQEIGLAERGTLRRELPTFDIDVQFTALVLNKREMSPRLLGFVEVRGSLEEAERASRESVGLSHREFGERPDKDAVPWERIRACPVTREAFASIFRRLRGNVSPECRARLLYYLKVKFPETWNLAPETEAPPPWL